MNIDKFTKMGTSHLLFEDSVITSNEDSDFKYIIVSDGCSGSENTHIGSHLLSRASEIELKKQKDISSDFGNKVIFRANYMAEIMGLKESALDATLLIAYEKNDKIYIWMTGDGCLYYKLNGVLNTLSIQYFNNTPYYLSYKLNELRDSAYHKKIELDLSKSDEKIIKKVLKWENEDFKMIDSDYLKPFLIVLDKKDLEYLILSTDGIESFIERSENTLSVIDNEMHKIKSISGDFIQRRIKRIIKEEMKNGLDNKDDLGLAGFSFEKGDDNEKI